MGRFPCLILKSTNVILRRRMGGHVPAVKIGFVSGLECDEVVPQDFLAKHSDVKVESLGLVEW